jgi:hypothetical protein
LPSGENSPKKTPLGSDFFCEKYFGKKISYYGFPCFWRKFQQKRGKM